MAKRERKKLVEKHPVSEEPYNRIALHDYLHGKPRYRVEGDARYLCAKRAVAVAFEIHGGRCFYCDKVAKPQKLSQHWTRDHIWPVSDGGADILPNIVLACGTCNRSKAAKPLTQFDEARAITFASALLGQLRAK